MKTVSDPIRLEVLRNALESIGDGMALTVYRTSRSTVVRASLDFSTAVLDANGQLVGQGMCVPIHLGGMMPALEACLNQYKGRVEPGDILISNDPYEGASHLPDIFLFKPVFLGDVLVGYLCAMTHHTDIGGRVPGGNACDNTEIYQEGLRIPPLKLYQRGEANETLFRILEKAVRVPDKVLGDLLSQIAALEFGEREFLRLVERFGVEDVDQYMEELLSYTEELTRKAIARLPDGSWSFTDYIDDDGFQTDSIAIVANLHKKGDEIHVDFTGTSPQVKGSIQPVFTTTKSVVYAVVKTVLSTVAQDIPNTAGYFRPIRVTAPEGSFLNPVPPAPVAARSLGLRRMSHALFGAFAQMLPGQVPACSGGCEYGAAIAGYDRSKTPWKSWVCMDFANEIAAGGRQGHDGIDAQNAGITNIANVLAEVIETEFPIEVEEYGLLADSEGAGEYRGGTGMVRQYRFLSDDTVVQVRSDRMKTSPYGINGGEASRRARIIIHSGGEERVMPSKFLTTVNAGDTMRVEWPGAGGWGDPLDRDPARVLGDVVAGKINARRAYDKYGVVLDESRRTVDMAATGELRQRRRGG